MDLPINDIISELHFIYVSSGIVMPVFIGIGLIGNAVILGVLSRKTMRSAPVCILQALAIHDALNMLYAIYADVYPAVTTYRRAQTFVEALKRAQNMHTKAEFSIDKSNLTTFFELLQMHPFCQNKSCGRTFTTLDIGFKSINESNNIENEMLLTTNQTNLLSTTEKQIKELSQEEQIDFITRSIERFIGYNLIYLGILFALCLAAERCFAVLFPLKVGNYLTINRTRFLVMAVVFVSLVVHTPQLIKEIILVNKNPDVLLTKGDNEKGLILSFRAIYERFYVISSLVFCIIMLILNILLLWKIISHRKSIENSKHIKNAERNELNISILIVVLVFFRLPHCVFANFVDEVLDLQHENSTDL